MLRGQYVLLALLAGVTFGSLAASGGYAWHLRSARYRNYCAARLSQKLGLPAAIGRVVPRSSRTREFQNVRVWLPAGRGELALCERAILTRTPSADDPTAYELALRGGRCEVSTRTWLPGDYRTVLESGLRPGFARDGPSRVSFSGISITLDHRQFRLVLGSVGGTLSFEDRRLGRVTATCRELNGHRAEVPVTMHAEFSPQTDGIRLQGLELDVPDLPLAILKLKELTGLGLQTGSLRGQLLCRPSLDRYDVTLCGKAFDLSLAEWTAGLCARPWSGLAPEIELEELKLAGDRPVRVRFRGALASATLGQILAPWGLEEIGGKLQLRVHSAVLSPAGVERLVISGQCEELSLEDLSEKIGWGRLSGEARIAIDDLTIADNHLVSADAELTVRTPGKPTTSNWIERGLLKELIARLVGLNLPDWVMERLPARLEYAQLGMRLEVRDERLYLFGTHGPHQKVILTIRVADQEWPVWWEPQNPIDLRPDLDRLRATLLPVIAQRWESFRVARAWRALYPEQQDPRRCESKE